MQDETKDSKQFLKRHRSDLIALAFLTLLITGIFFETIFAGKEISRAGTIAHRDTVFGRLAKSEYSPMDTCIYQEHLPSYFLVERVIAGGNMPLWNPYAGFGGPLLSDSQALALSPIAWLQAPFASIRLYNLLMVFQLWFGCIAAYFFARLFSLSPAASVLSSISFILSPYILYMYEWNRCQNALFSLPFLGFAWLWRKGTPSSIVLASIGCSALIYSGHISPTFFAVLMASGMYLALSYVLPQSKERTGPRAVFLPMRNLLLAGALTFFLSAPILVPFVETLRVSETFKSEQPFLRYVVNATAMLPSLFYPFHGPGSLYPGAVSIILAITAPFAAKKNKRLALTFFGLTICTLLAMARVGPFDLVFQLPFLKWLMLVYAVPGLLLFLGVLAGLGYEAVVTEASRVRTAIIVAVIALLPLSMPYLFGVMHPDGGQTGLNDWLTTMSVSSSVKVRELVFIVLTIAFAFAIARLPANLVSKIALCLIVLNFASLAFVIRKSLPCHPPFAYEEVEPIGFLKDQNRRIINMGRHVFVPNTGQIFGIFQTLSFFPNHPRGVTGYLRSLGVTIEGLGQYAEKPLTRLADIGAIKYAVASEPVLSADDKMPHAVAFPSGSIKFGKHARLDGVGLSLDPGNSDIICSLNWNEEQSEGKDKKALVYLPMVVRRDGGLVWVGDRHGLPAETAVAASIPKHLIAGEQVCLILQVIDSTTGQLIEPTNAPPENLMKEVPKSLLLARITVPKPGPEHTSAPRHFKLVKETAPEMVRVYENTGALPEAFLVYETRAVADVQSALVELMNPQFEPRKEALTEGISALDSKNGGKETLTAAKVKRPNVNEVIVESDCPDKALLVLTDVFFPGWRVFVDGNEKEIYRTNAIFRGVKLDKGRHIVRFVYDPPEVKAGFLLFALGIAAVIFLLRADRPKKAPI
jgi:hypothetical protein